MEAGFYDSNILPSAGGLVRKGEDGKWFLTASADVFQSDSKPLPAIDIPGDYGLWVQAVIENEALQTDSRPVLTSGEDITLTDLLDQLEKSESPVALSRPSHSRSPLFAGAGIQIERKLVTQEEAAETQKAAGTPPHIIEDFADMWDYNRDFGCELFSSLSAPSSVADPISLITQTTAAKMCIGPTSISLASPRPSLSTWRAPTSRTSPSELSAPAGGLG